MPPHHSLLPPAPEHAIEPELSIRSEHRWTSFAVTAALGWALMFGVCVGLGLLITGPLSDSGLVRWDRQYPAELEAARTAAGETWSHYGDLMGDTLTVVSIAFAVGLGLMIAKRWASVLLLATALLSEVTVFMATTIVVPRDRPDVEKLDVSPPTSSFPSGHTAAATTLLLSLAVIVGWSVRSTAIKVTAWLVAIAVGPIVGISRIYRGMHHPLDVIVGFGLGIACVVVAYLAVRAFVGEDA